MTRLDIDTILSFKGLIFDLDGTLLDSMRVWTEVDERFLNKRGFEVTQDYTDTVKSCSMQQSAEYTIKRFGLKETPDEVIAEWYNDVEKEYRENIKLKEGAKDVLIKAKEKGIKILSATALNRNNALSALENNGVLDLFDHVVTLDDVDFGINKCDPHIFLLTAEMAGVKPSECLVFEDVLGACIGAKSGGFKTAIVYDEVSSSDFEEGIKVADYYVEDWSVI